MKTKKVFKELLSELSIYDLADLCVSLDETKTLEKAEKVIVSQLVKTVPTVDMKNFILDEIGYSEYCKRVDNE